MPALLQEKRDGGTTRSVSDSSLVGRSPTTYDCEEDLPPLVFRKAVDAAPAPGLNTKSFQYRRPIHFQCNPSPTLTQPL